ncbi:c-type cytochrome [Mucilaginibacter sp. RS28]|uniref:C-type cytochrome n=1 Tax=Mucilaginibacter straminoryzae TaxID=2932774 RepID=A0A9X2B7U5_9SPHI|nr:cbb3-type cytochrome c oxidase N-terminal domain-containing protein [Mucilaginibacter straminoryzae]MCJ8208964.1 c-type cytochrome [Mucilaginibacter straminoryzae]
MKIIKPILLSALVLTGQPLLADDLISGEVKNYIGYGVIVFMLLVVLVAMLVLLRAFKVLTKVLLGPAAYAELQAEEAAQKAGKAKPKVSTVEKLLSLKPLEEEQSLIMEHEYDGIQELNNPTPAWFMGLFYVTIVFAVCYIFIYHVFGIGQLQYAEYKTEMAVAAKEKEAFLAKSANKVDENTVKLEADAATIAAGQSIFKQSCVPCHGDHAQGVVGPNLTDEYWLHGGSIKDVFKTIKYGVTAKGMPTWEKQLSPKQIADVANYVESLRGSHPANPKEPQGEKETEEAAAKPEAKTKAAMIVGSK